MTSDLVDLLRARAAREAERLAYVFLRDGEEEDGRLTYGDLDLRARAIGAALQQRVPAGERALLLFPAGLDFIAAFFGCLYAGIVAVPSYPPGSRRPQPRLQAIAHDARVRIVLTTAALAVKREELVSRVPELAAAAWLATDALEGSLAGEWRETAPGGDAIAFLQYTSGSIAAPKGVRVSHANLLHNEEMIRLAFGQSAASVILGWLPLYHDMGLIGNVLQPLYVGAQCILLSPVAFLQQPSRWLAAISRFRATTSGGPNFAYELCVRKVGEEQKAGLDLASWQVAFSGAEPVRAETLDRFAAAFASSGFRREAFHPCYGLAEATLFVAGGRHGSPPVARTFRADALEQGRGEIADDGRTLVGCGNAWLGQRLEIVDPGTLRPCPPGTVGEIWLAGPSVGQGYWENAERTASDFQARLAGEPAAGPFLRTGDLGFVDISEDNGELFVTGRLKDLIILRGRNHYPQDLELTAERAHPALRQGCGAAFAVEAAGEERLVIVQELERHAGAEPEEVAAAVRSAVAAEHEIQVYEVVLIRTGTIPKTSSGKIQRHACRAGYLAGELAVLARSAVAGDMESDGGAADEPSPSLLAVLDVGDIAERTAVVEAWLRQRAARALRVPPARVEPDRPLTALGLDSLAAVDLQHEIERGLGVAVALSGLLEGTTLRALAEQVVAQLAAGSVADGPRLIPAAETSAEGPLSQGQKALWFLHRLAPDSAAYHITAAVRIVGELDPAALRRAFQSLVDRHPALRTAFPLRDGGPVAQVREAVELAFTCEEAGGEDAAGLAALLADAAYRPFDLAAGPLLRIVLFRLGDGEHAMVLAVHHIVADFWSLAVLVEELGRCYARETGGATEPLSPLPVTYADWVRWQEARLAGPEGERLWSYWREALRGPLPDLDLPTDRPRPAVQTDRGASVALALGPELTRELHGLARAAGSTLFTTLLAVYQLLLHRYSGQTDFTVGCPVAGRGAAELAGLVGYFVNPVVVRADAADDPSFAAFLARVRKAALGALEHGDFPLTWLTERLQPVRDPSRSPLFQAMFTWQRPHRPEQQALAPFALGEAGARSGLGPLDLVSIPLARRPAQFDLTLMAAERGEEIVASLQFNADLFEPATAARMIGHWRNLLAGAAADPGLALSALPLLSAAEGAQLVAEWNATAAFSDQRALDELVAEQAERTPDRVAVEAADLSLTYAELAQRAAQLARQLAKMGIEPETPVGILTERTPDMVVGLLGVLAAGGSYVPIDPAYPEDRVAYMLADSEAPVVLTTERCRPGLAGHAGRLLVLDGEGPKIAEPSPGQSLRRARRPEPQLAYTIYTSGSTGRPKGVQVTHRGVVNFLRSMAQAPGIGPEDVLVAVTTLSFDIAGLELYLPLACGARVVLASRETAADGMALRRLLASSGATMMQATPATWRLLLAAGWDGSPPLRVLCGGEALPRELADQLLARSRSVWNLYGPTETTIWSAVSRVASDSGGPAMSAMISLGRPIANTSFHIVDGKLGPVPIGVPGELLIGGDGLARGYRGRPDLTAEKFMPDPWGSAPGGRLYRTGDLVRFRPGGDVEFLGRLDHQVKIRGFRVELGEVESALAAHPAVLQAVVVAREDPAGGRRLVAYGIFAGGAAPDVAELRGFLAARIPEAFVPSLYVALDRFPLTPNGKVDRRALPAPEASRAAGFSEVAGEAIPRSALERTIAGIWKEVLQVAAVGRHDNFFDLGGHSLLAAQVHARLRDALATELSMVDLFRYPTVAALAQYLAPAAPAAESVPKVAVPAGAEIAIVGMAGRFPGAATPAELWRRLRAGDELISFFADEELAASGVDPAVLANPAYVRAGGVIADAEAFDAAFFGFSPREAELMDPQHRVFLECAWHALEDAGYAPDRCWPRIGLYAGVGINTYLHHAGVERVAALAGRYQAFIANDKDFVPTRVSYKLNLRGPSINVQTACSTSLVALHLACQALRAGDCDMAMAGGVAIRSPQRLGYLYEEGGIPSPDGHCRAFDAGAQGTVFGNGVGVVVLKPLARALADGDTVHAVIKGSAINNDGGLKVGYTAPSVQGQAQVIAAALAAAGVDPATVSYVEAHGTGTPMGDPIEVAALSEVFATGTAQRGFCALGSVKTNLGHLDTAAGVAGLIKTVLALEHRELPPSLHFATPNPRIDFAASPFFVNAALRPWEVDHGPRRAGVSSFGIGGTNAHVILEEAPPRAPSGPSRPWQLLLLSARTPAALDSATSDLAAALGEEAGPSLAHFADIAHTLRVGRKAFACRRMLVCAGRDEAAVALAAVDPEKVLNGTAEAGERSVAFLFPGQGAQHAGMARGLYESEPTFRRELDGCAELLLPHLGLDLRQLLAAGAELERTELAQPVLFAVEYALARLWMSWGILPAAMLGHSVGEYVAACLAGVFTLPAALALVALRGRLMQSLPGGAMLGVQLAEAEVSPLLGGDLSLAAVNAPAACVVSGPTPAVEELARRLDARGIRHRRLHTSHAFHSAMMEPILAAFTEAVRQAVPQPPQIPCLSNLTGTWLTAAQATDPAYWARHLRGAVRFADGVRELLADAERVLLEVGPGNALGNLARQSVRTGDRRLIVSSLPHPQEAQPDAAVLLRALGRLWLAGVDADWEAFASHEDRRRVPLPLYPFERQRYWLEKAQPAAPAVDPLARRADPAEWVWAPLWRQSVPPPPSTASAESWLLLGDADGPGGRLVATLAARLERQGQRVALARTGDGFARVSDGRFTVDPSRREDFSALLAALREADRLPHRVVHAWNVTAPGETTPAALLAGLADAQVRAYDSLLALAQALEGERAPAGARLAVLSNRLHRVTGGDFPQPSKALLLGPVAVIPQEIPGLACRSIDLDGFEGDFVDEDLAEDLLAEIDGGDAAEVVVAWRGGERWVRTFGPVRLAADDGPVPRSEHGVVLITGGFGGIGLTLAEELAQRPGARLALVGRSSLPARETWEERLAAGGEEAERIRRVRALEALGAEVLPLAADVTDEAALAAAIAAAEERFGPIRGVVHAAGVPGGGLLQLATPAGGERVLAPKVRGTLLLHALLAHRALDFFVLCSSINSVIGGFGQIDYCAANAFQDAFAQARHRRRGPRFLAIGWDRWEEVGMAARASSPLALWRADSSAPVHPLHPLHPLLNARIESSAEREVWTTELAVERHWVLSEHRIAGRPTVPGTTFLEMARAAFAGHADGRPVEIRDAAFLSPLVVAEGAAREVRTTLAGSGDEREFRIASRAGGEPWQEHARGWIAAAAAGPSRVHDLAALLAACSRDEVTERRRNGDFLVTGPRWGSLQRLHLGDGQSVAVLELDERFAAELADYVLHPALLDVAAGAVQLLGDGDYLPLAYDRLIVHGPVARRSFSHFRLRAAPGDLLTCDILLLDETGRERVEIQGFSMRRVSPEAAEQLRRAASPPAGGRVDLAASVGGGIRPAEGALVFRRLLSSATVPHLVVSTRDLPAVMEEARGFDRERLAESLAGAAAPTVHARPDVSSVYAPPADDLEQRIAALWEGVLGIERIGVHDNFFELGGTSLSGIQLVSELKKQLGVEVPTVSIFQAPTVSALVKYLRPPQESRSEFERSRSRAEKKKQVFARARRAMGATTP